MCNELKQGRKSRGWEVFLIEAKRQMAEAKDGARRKELNQAVKGFESLIKQGAPMPRKLRRRVA